MAQKLSPLYVSYISAVYHRSQDDLLLTLASIHTSVDQSLIDEFCGILRSIKWVDRPIENLGRIRQSFATAKFCNSKVLQRQEPLLAIAMLNPA
ncbi:MAG: hypothetical protein HC771_04350 [Synechococcales cyanobacterium CRU_2_2]|nr:hypothetical protein [Synechococcales cyanobacterium CRU_2_2]